MYNALAWHMFDRPLETSEPALRGPEALGLPCLTQKIQGPENTSGVRGQGSQKVQKMTIFSRQSKRCDHG